MNMNRKAIRSSIYDYVKAHYWALFTPLFIIFILTSIVDLIIGWVLVKNNLQNLVYISTFISYLLSIYGFGVYTIALVDCLRTEQTMSVKHVINVIQTQRSRLFLLSLEMTFLLVILAIIGAMIHPIVESLTLAFISLAYAFAFPISVDQPSLNNIKVISASFKQTTGLRWNMLLLQLKPVLIVLVPVFIAVYAIQSTLTSPNSMSNANIFFWIAMACALLLFLRAMPKVLSVYGFVYQSMTTQTTETINDLAGLS